MAHVTVDDSLVREAREAGGHRTMKSAVTEALAEYVSRRKHQPDFFTAMKELITIQKRNIRS